MSDLPKTINPDRDTQVFEALSMNKDDFEFLEFVRRQMRQIYSEEQKNKSENKCKE